MKKFLAVLCMITCIFGLTACSTQTVEKSNRQLLAEQFSKDLIRTYTQFMVEGEADKFLAEYNAKEAALIMKNTYASIAQQVGYNDFNFDGAGVLGSVTSFESAIDTVGPILEYGEPQSRIKNDEIVVTVAVTGEKKTGKVEVIISDDLFFEVKSCAINVDLTTGEMMEKAALNTLLGMGTVFVVLILIMFIISAFALIPKIQNKMASKKKAASQKKAGKEQVELQVEKTAETTIENPAEDLELVAVIAAAVAACEGAASTDGFVVRSIRRANRR